MDNDLQYQYIQGLYTGIIGKGEAVIFVHGGPGGDHRFFLPHMLPLSEQYRLILYDQRGCGMSDASSNGQYTMKDEVEALEMLRKDLQLDKVNLFGESWGSMLALMYACAYPDRINKILLTAAIGLNVDGYHLFEKELEKRIQPEDKRALTRMEEALKAGTGKIDEIFNILDPYYVYSAASLLRKEKIYINHVVNEAIGKDIEKNYDVTESLQKLRKIPLLIAQGTHDILTPDHIKNLITNRLPHTKLMEVANCGHWTVVEQPEAIMEIALDFFSSTQKDT